MELLHKDTLGPKHLKRRGLSAMLALRFERGEGGRSWQGGRHQNSFVPVSGCGGWDTVEMYPKPHKSM